MDWIPPVCFIQTIEIDGFKSIQYMRESPYQPCTMVIGRNREATSTWTEARPKFLVANDGASREKLRRMIWPLSGLFTRGYQLLKGSEVVRAKVCPMNWNAPWTGMTALVKMEDGTVKRPSALDEKELAIASLALIYGINAYLCSSFIIVEEIHRIYDRNDFLQKMEGLKKLATVRRGPQIIGTYAPPPARARGVYKIFFTH